MASLLAEALCAMPASEEQDVDLHEGPAAGPRMDPNKDRLFDVLAE